MFIKPNKNQIFFTVLSIITIIIITFITYTGLNSFFAVSKKYKTMLSYKNDLQLLINKSSIIKKNNQVLNKKIISINKKVYSEKKIYPFLSKISDYASANNIDVLSFNPSEYKTDDQFNSVTIDISLSGSLENFIKYLNITEENINQMQIDKLNISNNAADIGLIYSLRLKIFSGEFI